VTQWPPLRPEDLSRGVQRVKEERCKRRPANFARECAEHVFARRKDLHDLYGEVAMMCNPINRPTAQKLVRMSQEALAMHERIGLLLHDLARELESER